MIRSRRVVSRAALVTFAVSGFASGGATTPSGTSLTWVGNGLSNGWTDLANWSNNGLHPFGPGSSATIISDDAGLGGLNINVDHLNLQNATLVGAGTLTANLSMSITSINPSTSVLDTLYLRNNGTANLNGGGILTNNAATIENNGTMNVSGNVTIETFFAPPARLLNNGLITKTGAEQSTIRAFLVNSGTIRASAGTLAFSNIFAGVNANTGTFESNGGSIKLANVVLGGGANFRGTGTGYLAESNVIDAALVATGARLKVVGADNAVSGTITLQSGGVLELGVEGPAGELEGNGRIQGAGTFQFTGGILTGAITPGSDLTNSANFHITGPEAKTLNSGRFHNAGNGVWDEGNITTLNSFVFTNSGTMDLRSDNSLTPFFFGPATLVNTGTWKKTAGTGTSTINIDVQGNGTFLATSGVLLLDGVGSNSINSGRYISSGAGVVQLSGQTLSTGTTFLGNGTSQLAADNTFVGDSQVAAGAAARIVGTNNSVLGAVNVSGVLELTGSGELRGSGTLAGGGTFSWTGGTIVGNTNPGTSFLTNLVQMHVTGPDTKTLTAGRFANNATLTWDGGNIVTNFDATFSNAGTMDLRSDDDLTPFFFGPSTLRNSGTIKKTAGTGTSLLNIDLVNTGTVLASSGFLRLKGVSAASSGTGTFISNGSGVVQLEAQTLAGGSSFAGTGTSELLADNFITGLTQIRPGGALRAIGQANGLTGTLSIASTARFNLDTGGAISGNGRIDGPGTFLWTGGSLTGPTTAGVDALTIAAPTDIAGAVSLNGGRVSNLGTVRWLSGNITTSNGPVFANSGTFDIRAGNDLGPFFAPIGQFNNTGLLAKTAGGATSFGAIVNSTGTIRIDTGSMNFTQNFTSTGTFTLAAGADVSFSGADTTIGGSQSWPAGYLLNQNSGTLTFLSDAGATGANLAVTSSATTIFASTQHLAGLNVVNYAQIAPNGGRVVVTKSLTFPSFFPTLDVSNNTMIVDYDGANTPYATIRTRIISGYSGGSWTGNGINSSTAANTSGTGVGYIEASDILSAPGTFAGEPVDLSAVLVRYTLLGDANLDRVVNINDFARLGPNFNQPGDWFDGDFNYSGTVNIGDFSLLAANFNRTLMLSAPLPRAAVPEPAAAAVLALAAVICRRRRAT